MPDEKKKICFVIPSLAAGGIQTYLLRFLELFKKEYRVTVIIRGDCEGELLQEYRDTNVKLLSMRLGYLNIVSATRYFIFFKKEKFDVVCDFNANFAGGTMLLARLAGVAKRIAFYRQGRDHFKPGILKNRVNRFLNRLVYIHATDILFNSKAAVDVFFPDRSAADQRFDVIYNGVTFESSSGSVDKNELREKFGVPPDKFLIGHVGRNDSSKNHKTIFDTAEKLVKKYGDIHFVLCGTDTENLKSDIEHRGLGSDFTILGYRNDVPDLLQALDLFFFPSITEGQPNALIEAMMAGLPVMASDIAPIRECMPKGFESFLAEPNDSNQFSKIACTIRNQDKSQWSSLSVWAGQKFDSETNFKKFQEKLY